MKKLLLAYLTLPILFSAPVMAFANQAEIQKINLIDETKIAQAKSYCQWQVTKDRAITATIVTGVILGGLYYKYGRGTGSSIPTPDVPVVPAPQPIQSAQILPAAVSAVAAPALALNYPALHGPVTIEQPEGAVNAPAQQVIEAVDNSLNIPAQLPTETMQELAKQLKAYNTRPPVGFLQGLWETSKVQLWWFIAISIKDALPKLIKPIERSFGLLRPVTVFAKNKTHLKHARSLVSNSSLQCKVTGYSDYYLGALTRSINYTIDQLTVVLGYMDYCADKFKARKDESAYKQANMIRNHIIETTKNFASQMDEIVTSDRKSRMHDAVLRYLDQMDIEIDRFDELIYNS